MSGQRCTDKRCTPFLPFGLLALNFVVVVPFVKPDQGAAIWNSAFFYLGAPSETLPAVYNAEDGPNVAPRL